MDSVEKVIADGMQLCRGYDQIGAGHAAQPVRDLMNRLAAIAAAQGEVVRDCNSERLASRIRQIALQVERADHSLELYRIADDLPKTVPATTVFCVPVEHEGRIVYDHSDKPIPMACNFKLYTHPAPAVGVPDALKAIAAERRRQIETKGWTPEHDDAHPSGEIAAFAAVYAMPPAAREWPAKETGYGKTFAEAMTPLGWVPKFSDDRRRELVKAGALIVAEIERLGREAASPTPQQVRKEGDGS